MKTYTKFLSILFSSAQWPYERQDKSLTVEEEEMAYHNASRPTWGPNETLVVTRSIDATQFRRSLRDNSDILQFQRGGIQTERQDVRLAKFSAEVGNSVPFFSLFPSFLLPFFLSFFGF